MPLTIDFGRNTEPLLPILAALVGRANARVEAGETDAKTEFENIADILQPHHYGIEGVMADQSSLRTSPSMRYLNTGETYEQTVVLDDSKGLMICSWGDWLEGAEEEYREDEERTRCDMCGEFYDSDDIVFDDDTSMELCPCCQTS